MSLINSPNLIKANLFDICKIDGKTKQEIIRMYYGREYGAYYLDKFNRHIKTFHKIDIKEYCKKYLDVIWPLCPISKEEVGFKICGAGLILSKFKKGRINKEFSPKFAKFCERISKERKGSGNPMFGKQAWNAGLDRTDPRIDKIAAAREGSTISEETRAKQSESGKKRLIHGHTGHKHSPETKENLRLNTAKLWASGKFNRTSSIHLKVKEYLNTLNLNQKYEEEYQVKYFSMDFAFPEAKVAIEVQGTYFHVDPRVYPNGPINSTQRRNFGRDKAKKIVCSREGWYIIELWETEINDGQFKQFLLCRLLELNLLNQ